MKNYEVEMLLANMENVNAWLRLTVVQGDNDIQQFGSWRVDYAAQAAAFQRDFDNAGRALVALLGGGDDY